MTMFQLDKESHLVTVPTDVKLSDIKRFLAEEGLYFGYYPLDEPQYTLAYYLNRRVPNLYYFKFRGLADLVSSLHVELGGGKSFQFKDAPRAAIGPDFNRWVIGSREMVGRIKDATLRVASLPEKVVHAIVLIDNREDARKIIRGLMSQFVEPLYFRYFDTEPAGLLLKELGHDAKSSDLLLLCLTGLHDIVTVEEEITSELCGHYKKELFWVAKKQGREIVNAHLHHPDSLREIKDQYRTFIWPTTDPTSQNTLEKRFITNVLQTQQTDNKGSS